MLHRFGSNQLFTIKIIINVHLPLRLLEEWFPVGANIILWFLKNEYETSEKKYRAMFLNWNEVYMPLFTYFGAHWHDIAWSTSICILRFHSILPAKLCLVIHSYAYVLAWVQQLLFYFTFSLQNTWVGRFFPTFHQVSTVFKQTIIWHVTYNVMLFTELP